MLTVRYRGMWPGFSPSQGGLPAMVRQATGGAIRIVGSNREVVDLEVCSVFPPRLRAALDLGRGLAGRALRPTSDYRNSGNLQMPSGKAKRSIWYTGENLRPPPLSCGWDLTLSFESDGWPNNAYLPLWLLGTDAFGEGGPNFLGGSVRLQDLLRGRPDNTYRRRPRFACAFIRNPEPTRLSVIQALGEVGEVEVFGPMSGRPLPTKGMVAKDYRFMLCMENDLYPGYVTEKPVEAWASGCVPLWWGIDRDGNLNPASLVNLADADGLSDFVDRVATIDMSDEVLEGMWRQPALLHTPRVDGLIQSIRALL